ncbi:MAG: hypothetical protein INR69_00460 [Mucilaginibacter polytrichastri]|nr:hypothetical protein [Mucilaginibacter polytrichastri]
MRNRLISFGISILFLFIFAVKMGLSVAPLFISLDKKSVNAVIMQLEHDENEAKKGDAKESGKEKKGCDEHFAYLPVFSTIAQPVSVQEIHDAAGDLPAYHPNILTPPPNRG